MSLSLPSDWTPHAGAALCNVTLSILSLQRLKKSSIIPDDSIFSPFLREAILDINVGALSFPGNLLLRCLPRQCLGFSCCSQCMSMTLTTPS